MVHPEQDVFWIEHELLMAKERIEPRRERLIELGITHILKARPPRPNLTTGPFLSSAMYARRAQVGPVLSNQHPQDFIYCRLYVSDKETARQDDIRREFGMGLAFASEALDLGGRVLICCPTGCRLAVAATVALLMQKRGMRLSTAYGVVKLHEPALQLSRALCLWLSLYEIELHHESSVVRDRTFTNPSLKQLVGELGLEPALPWPLPIYFLVGTVVLPDPYAFWNGRPRTDFRPWRKRYCAPRRRTSRFCSGSASVSTQVTTAAATASTRPPSAAARRRSRGSSGRRKPRTTPCRTRPSRPSTSTSAPSPRPRPRS